MTPTTYGRDFAYCLKSHGGVRGFYASLWRFLLRCTLFCHSVATFLTSVSSYEGGCGFEDDNTSTLDRVLIYAAIIYTILPMDLLPSVIYKFLGILDDGVAMLFVYKKIKDKITTEINARVEDTLNEWFGVEYELVEG